ncbi:MAG: hypothetical protein ACOCV2_11395 [Persicimonas sp.]
MPFAVNRWILKVGAVLAATGLLITPSSPQAQEGDEEVRRTNQCDGYMKAYARSASRKLARAFRGQDYQLEDLPDRSTLSADGQTFEIAYEEDGLLASAVERTRDHRNSYVMAQTPRGPIIAAHRWPGRQKVASGRADCKPLASRILMPNVPVSDIDTEPFKFWGLRVVWHLPDDATTDAKGEGFDALAEAIEETSEDDFDLDQDQPDEAVDSDDLDATTQEGDNNNQD